MWTTLQRSPWRAPCWLLAASLLVASGAQAQTVGTCGLPLGTVVFGLTADHRLLEYTLTADPPRVAAFSITAQGNINVPTATDHGLVGIDFRPADPDQTALYLVTDQGDIRVMNAFPGVMRSPAISNLVSPLAMPFQGGLHSVVDFNPVVDALRVVGSNDQNFAVVNSAGNLNQAVAQTAFRYVAGDPAAGADPYITAGAYDSNVAGAPRTTFYTLDYVRDTLVTIADRTATGSSNTGGGALKTIGRLVDRAGNPFNVPPGAGLDIVTTAAGRNVAIGTGTRRLFCLDLASVDADLPVGTTRDVTVTPAQPDLAGGFSPLIDGLIDVAVPPRAPVAADLSIRLTRFDPGTPTTRLGDLVQYEIRVRNAGPSIASGVRINLTSTQSNVGPLNVTNVLSAGSDCSTYLGNKTSGFCILPSLVSGREQVLQLSVQTIRPAARPSSTVRLTTSVEVIGLVPDPDAGNNSATVTTTLAF